MLDATGGGAPPARPRFFTVDLHCHALSPAVEALVAGHPQKQAEAQRSLV